ncbi:dynein heavy chain, partial [Spiromyces aspiralis]
NDGPDRLTGISQMAKVESLVGPLVRHIQGSKTGELNRRHVLQALMLDELECVRYPLIAGIIDAQQQQQPAGDALLLAKERSAVTVADYDRDFLVQVRRIAAGSGLLVSKPQLEANNYYSIRLGGATLSKLPVISAGARVKLAGFSHQPQPQQQPQQYQWSFKVKPLGMGEYYGFTIASGSNRRVLLSRDLAVSHNTESVKALGTQLGRFVLVFCCDENFDFQAMGRIFVGLCQVGAWGCFDEFNRLEERILSAVSQQIQTIQLGLRKSLESSAKSVEIELVGKSVRLHNDTGIFITMNPGYAGRSNLPDNLKKLFRSFAMTKPDRELIAQVMLYSQGFRTAELLASKVVPLFNLCMEQLSPQPHYDFGLRALKSVLVSAGNLKRGRLLNEAGDDPYQPGGSICDEQELLIQSIRETVMPKLVGSDIPLLDSLLTDVFPGVNYMPVNLERLCAAINEICERHNWIPGQMWMDKVVQLYQIQNIHHGLMMVGPSGTGKTSAWQTLLAAMEKLDGIEGVPYVIDPKAVSKDDLYGTLDPTTREWTDGLFTHILRKIVDNVRGESAKRHWIVFDGDVDPEWVENLNSVLDDNRLLTLPNGERLALPSNVRIMFEVETLKYATLATVSRCGMVWFSDDIVSFDMVCRNYLETLKTVPLDADDDGDLGATVVASARRPEDGAPAEGEEEEEAGSPILRIQREAALVLAPHFEPGNLVERCLDYATSLAHIMDFTRMRALSTLFSLLNQAVCSIL